MTNSPVYFSVIIPNFNSGKYLEEAILSVINQGYQNYELIVIDGQSKDQSIEIIKKHEKEIAYWISEPDNGQTAAINKGIQQATGDYIAFLNADDAYLPDTFKYLSGLIQQYSQPDFLYGNVRIGSDLNTSDELTNVVKNAKLAQLVNFYFSNKYIIPSQSVFIKREFLIKNNLQMLNENLHYCMDLDWYCRIATFNPFVFKYTKTVSFFRITPETKTSSQNKQMQLEANQMAFQYLSCLNKTERDTFFKRRYLAKILSNVYSHKLTFCNVLAFQTILKSGGIALTDRRFLGLIKQNIFKFA